MFGKFKEEWNSLANVLPITGVVRLDYEQAIRCQNAVDQSHKLWGDQAFVNLCWIVKGLRVVTVNFGDTSRGDVVRQKFPATHDREPHIAESPLVSTSSCITNDNR